MKTDLSVLVNLEDHYYSQLQQYKDLANHLLWALRDARNSTAKYGEFEGVHCLNNHIKVGEEKLTAIETPSRQKALGEPCISPKAEEKMQIIERK